MTEKFTAHECLVPWYIMIDDYARRKLTYETDRLPAIARLATEAQKLLGFWYIAGLSLEDIHWGLLWRARGRATAPREYVAPSRSWVSVIVTPNEIKDEYDPEERHDFPIHHRSVQERGLRSLEATIIDVNMKNVINNNAFLQVSSGVLTIRSHGQLLSSLIIDARNFDKGFVLKFSSRAVTDEDFNRRTVLDFDFKMARENSPFSPERHMKVLLIAQWGN